MSSALPLRSQLAPGCRPGRTQRGTKEPQGRGHRQTRASSQRLGPWLRPGHSPPWALLPPRARGSPDPRGCGPEGHLCPQGKALDPMTYGRSVTPQGAAAGVGWAHPAVPQFPPGWRCSASATYLPPGARFRASMSFSGPRQRLGALGSGSPLGGRNTAHCAPCALSGQPARAARPGAAGSGQGRSTCPPARAGGAWGPAPPASAPRSSFGELRPGFHAQVEGLRLGGWGVLGHRPGPWPYAGPLAGDAVPGASPRPPPPNPPWAIIWVGGLGEKHST